MTLPTILGIDPGLTTGIALRTPSGTWELVQTTRGAVLPIVRAMLHTYDYRALIAVEAFVVGPRAARSSTPEAGRIARDLIGALQALEAPGAVRVVVRTAGAVKPWATDRRLSAAGVPAVRGMPHARDAARHALFALVKDCGFPDPLSKRGSGG